MHYVISYDIGDDRLRAKVAQTLLRHGADRVQKSVFVLARLDSRALVVLRRVLTDVLAQGKHSPEDSILVVPVRDGDRKRVIRLGHNKAFTNFEPLPRKIML
jgi:CRISPR-associated endonuclease Cas2